MTMVSCLCITYNRSHYLRKAIECFLSQTHQESELVVIYDRNDLSTTQLLHSFDSPKIKPYPQEDLKSKTLGENRNLAISYATGDYICNWDDDDWSNLDRIEMQISAIARHKKNGCILSRLFIHNEVQNVSFLSYRRMWENTIIVNRQFILENKIWYPKLDSHEDYEFVNSLIKHNALYALEDATLYIYRYTGKNTCSRAHFDRLFGYSFELTSYQNIVIARAFAEKVGVVDTAKRMYSHNFQSSLAYVPFTEDRP